MTDDPSNQSSSEFDYDTEYARFQTLVQIKEVNGGYVVGLDPEGGEPNYLGPWGPFTSRLAAELFWEDTIPELAAGFLLWPYYPPEYYNIVARIVDILEAGKGDALSLAVQIVEARPWYKPGAMR